MEGSFPTSLGYRYVCIKRNIPHSTFNKKLFKVQFTLVYKIRFVFERIHLSQLIHNPKIGVSRWKTKNQWTQTEVQLKVPFQGLYFIVLRSLNLAFPLILIFFHNFFLAIIPKDAKEHVKCKKDKLDMKESNVFQY